jgi:hypothetical protein
MPLALVDSRELCLRQAALGELHTLVSMLALHAAFKDRLSMPTNRPAVQYAHCLCCPFNFFCHACDNLLSNAVLLNGSRCCMCLKVSTICIHSPPPCSSDSEPSFLPSVPFSPPLSHGSCRRPADRRQQNVQPPPSPLGPIKNIRLPYHLFPCISHTYPLPSPYPLPAPHLNAPLPFWRSN